MSAPLCRNTFYAHPNHYGDKYHGDRLECSNAGVEELIEQRDALAKLLREVLPDWEHMRSDEGEVNTQWRNDLAAEIRAALALCPQSRPWPRAEPDPDPDARGE